jgi:hypothetical protein
MSKDFRSFEPLSRLLATETRWRSELTFGQDAGYYVMNWFSPAYFPFGHCVSRTDLQGDIGYGSGRGSPSPLTLGHFPLQLPWNFMLAGTLQSICGAILFLISL